MNMKQRNLLNISTSRVEEIHNYENIEQLDDNTKTTTTYNTEIIYIKKTRNKYVKDNTIPILNKLTELSGRIYNLVYDIAKPVLDYNKQCFDNYKEIVNKEKWEIAEQKYPEIIKYREHKKYITNMVDTLDKQHYKETGKCFSNKEKKKRYNEQMSDYWKKNQKLSLDFQERNEKYEKRRKEVFKQEFTEKQMKFPNYVSLRKQLENCEERELLSATVFSGILGTIIDQYITYFKTLKVSKRANPPIRKIDDVRWKFYIRMDAYKTDGTPSNNSIGKFKDGKITFSHRRKKSILNDLVITVDKNRLPDNANISNITITPSNYSYIIGITYRIPVKEKLDNEKIKQVTGKFAGIDLGMKNLITLVDESGKSIKFTYNIISDRLYKYNKGKSYRMKKYSQDYGEEYEQIETIKQKLISGKRERFFRTTWNQLSCYIVDYLVANNIKYVTVGRNKEWKQGLRNMGEFVSIPFYTLIFSLINKATKRGIKIEDIGETYTSKASFFDRDEIPKTHKNTKKVVFSGERINRDQYKRNNGQILCADINAAANIMRLGYQKIMGTDFPTTNDYSFEQAVLHSSTEISSLRQLLEPETTRHK